MLIISTSMKFARRLKSYLYPFVLVEALSNIRQGSFSYNQQKLAMVRRTTRFLEMLPHPEPNKIGAARLLWLRISQVRVVNT